MFSAFDAIKRFIGFFFSMISFIYATHPNEAPLSSPPILAIVDNPSTKDCWLMPGAVRYSSQDTRECKIVSTPTSLLTFMFSLNFVK
jgi:hypothetical protein